MTWRIILLVLLTLASWSTLPAAAADGDAPFTEARLRALLAHNPQTGRPVAVNGWRRCCRRNAPGISPVYDSRSPFMASITPEQCVILFTDDARLGPSSAMTCSR
jgi:hypothetical protein